MAARAIWKGIVRVGSAGVPVKLYAAIEDRRVHFRLLHEEDHAPVGQVLVNPRTEVVVPRAEALRAYATDEGELVVLRHEELEALEPEKSRDIHVAAFLPPSTIDHRWYRRPYYLGPDGSDADYFALIGSLERCGLEGVARWTMRKKEYVGALRLQDGYPVLITLHHAGEVLSLEELEAPDGARIDEAELDLARRLIEMYEASFDPADYRDEYRARVRDFIERKARGEGVEAAPPVAPRATQDLAAALQRSLERERKRA